MIKIIFTVKNILCGVLNLLKFKCIRSYRNKQEELFDKRLKICESCKYVNKDLRQCKQCGCFIDAKTKVTYKLDEDGLAIAYIDPINKDVYYACPKIYW